MAQCFICGNDNPNVLETHHKIPRRRGGTDHAENTVVLCANCHRAIERIYDEDFWSTVAVADVEKYDPGQVLSASELDSEAEEIWL